MKQIVKIALVLMLGTFSLFGSVRAGWYMDARGSKEIKKTEVTVVSTIEVVSTTQEPVTDRAEEPEVPPATAQAIPKESPNVTPKSTKVPAITKKPKKTSEPKKTPSAKETPKPVKKSKTTAKPKDKSKKLKNDNGSIKPIASQKENTNVFTESELSSLRDAVWNGFRKKYGSSIASNASLQNAAIMRVNGKGSSAMQILMKYGGKGWKKKAWQESGAEMWMEYSKDYAAMAKKLNAQISFSPGKKRIAGIGILAERQGRAVHLKVDIITTN